MSKFALLRPKHLTDHSTLEFTLNTWTRHFPLSANGYRCQTPDLWRVLVSAAARRSTIEATCHDLLSAPGSSTVRSYLNEQLAPPQVRSLQDHCNQALASQIPPWLQQKARHQALDIAIDLHDEPYYGTADLQQEDHWICRGEAQAGTTRFYRCATAYVMRNDVRFTLAVEFVHPTQGLLEIVQHLLQQVRTLHIQIARLYLDKAFCCVAVLRYLQTQQSLAAIVAVPLRGKKGGTRALCQMRGSYRTHYTFVSPIHGSITVPVGVVRTQAKRRDGSRRTQWLLYVLLRVSAPLPWVRQHYRLRFGIESSYRLLEQVRVKTTSNNPALRFLCIGLALVLGNIWIALHWLYLRVRASGPPRVARQLFPLERMTRFLCRAVEAIYGVISLVPAENAKPAIY